MPVGLAVESSTLPSVHSSLRGVSWGQQLSSPSLDFYPGEEVVTFLMEKFFHIHNNRNGFGTRISLFKSSSAALVTSADDL